MSDSQNLNAVVPHGSIGVTILGATGSIGVSTLNVIAQHPDRYRVVALTANLQVERLLEQCRQFLPEYAVMVDAVAAEQLQTQLKAEKIDVVVLSGKEGLETVARLDQVRQVMAAIVGAAGLAPTLVAAKAGKRILLANKESLVMSGQIFMDAVQEGGAELLPIDSEHNAIFQSMPSNFSKGLTSVGVQKILLTASGGPFRKSDLAELALVTPDQACAHPNWKMGRKISVDSATMMNKGLEVIEACWLFGTTPDRIQVVIHPQSIIHSMVSYDDGSVIAQMGNPDMRTPIAHAMAWPTRMSSGVEPLNLIEIGQFDFEEPDTDRFPCLRLAYEAMETGGVMPAILNAANEIAVQAFLENKLAFMAIPEIIEKTMQQLTDDASSQGDISLPSVIAADNLARNTATTLLLEHRL